MSFSLIANVSLPKTFKTLWEIWRDTNALRRHLEFIINGREHSVFVAPLSLRCEQQGATEHRPIGSRRTSWKDERKKRTDVFFNIFPAFTNVYIRQRCLAMLCAITLVKKCRVVYCFLSTKGTNNRMSRWMTSSLTSVTSNELHGRVSYSSSRT